MFEDDLDPFFEDFAEDVRVTFSSGASRTFAAIVETPTEGVAEYGSEVESDAPYLRCRTSDTTGIRRGNTVRFRDANHTVERVRHEGSGTSLIFVR